MIVPLFRRSNGSESSVGPHPCRGYTGGGRYAASSKACRALVTFACLILFQFAPATTVAIELALDCEGKSRFVHRGAPSTVPAADKRSYRFAGGQLDGLDCRITDADIGCHGLTAQQAYRRIAIDRTAGTVSDTLELPTSMLIFEGSCR